MMMHRISWSRNKVERKREGAKENKDKQIRKEEMICVTIEFCSSSLLLCQICFRKRSATGLVVQHSLLVITMMRIKANVNPWPKTLKDRINQKKRRKRLLRTETFFFFEKVRTETSQERTKKHHKTPSQCLYSTYRIFIYIILVILLLALAHYPLFLSTFKIPYHFFKNFFKGKVRIKRPYFFF